MKNIPPQIRNAGEGQSNWFVVRDAADSGPVEILIYDQIGTDWFSNTGVNAEEFARAL